MKEEHIVRKMLDVDITVKIRRERPHLRGKDACKRNMTEAGLKEGNVYNKQGSMGESDQQLYRRWDKPGTKKKNSR